MTDHSPMPPKRKRGGQKGNRNALKHGFYSRQLRPAEIADLQDITRPVDLESEIEAERVVLRRIMESIAECSSAADLARLSTAQATVVNTLNRLVRTQSLISKPPSEDDLTLLQALEKVHLEYKISALNVQENNDPVPAINHRKPRHMPFKLRRRPGKNLPPVQQFVPPSFLEKK